MNRTGFAFSLALLVPIAHAVPPGMLEKVKKSASRLVLECAPARHDEFVERFERLFVEVAGPLLDASFAKVQRSREALEKARTDYISCIRDARERDLIPREACAAQHEHFLERESTVRALHSPEGRRSLTREASLAFTRALLPLAKDFPECDLRRLKTIGREVSRDD
jgi:hypothetical protein